MPSANPSLLSGIIAAVLVIAVALFIVTGISPALLSGWLSLLLVAIVPTQIVYGALWNNARPQIITRLSQPWCGLMQLAISVIIGIPVAAFALWVPGGGSPNPFANMFLILSVPVTFWLVAVWQGWPCSLLFKNKGLLGIATLLLAYALTYLLFRTLFDFGFASGAPFYQSALDPHGLLLAWYPLTAALAALTFMLMGILLDFWPASALAQRLPITGRQPLWALVVSLGVAVCTALLWLLFINVLQMDIVMFMVRICVCTIFGIFILLVIMQGVPSLSLPQPLRGLALIAIAVASGQLAFWGYGYLGRLTFGLATGAPGYALELWMASGMLSVTFPAMVLFAQYFAFWPMKKGAREFK